MSRHQKIQYKIGDLVWRPLVRKGIVWDWQRAVVESINGTNVTVSSYNHSYTHDAISLAPRNLGTPTGKPKVLNSDKQRAFS